jgi:hypothetical protein
MRWPAPISIAATPPPRLMPHLAIALTLVAATTTAQAVVATASEGRAATRANAARTISVRDAGHLHFIRSSGSRLIDEGAASGSIPGKVRVQFIYDGNPIVTAYFTLYSPQGSFSGRARGRLSDPTSLDPSFRGSLSISGGTGRYAGAHGDGELFGVFNRRNYGLAVQTIAILRY